MAVAWAHQDHSRPLNQTEQRAKKIKQLRGQLTESEKKLATKEEELKTNEIELVAMNERLESTQAKVWLLKGELVRLHTNNRSLKDQLGEAKVVAANAVSEYQSSVEMAAFKQTIRDEAYEKVAESFAYTTTTQHSDWDLANIGDHLAAQIAKRRAGLQANQPLAEERPARLSSLIVEP